MQIQDTRQARDFFAQKLAFVTGPFELDGQIKRREAITVVDVRLPSDYRAGHIPGAINLPQGKWHTLPACRKTAPPSSTATARPASSPPPPPSNSPRPALRSWRWKAASKPGKKAACRSRSEEHRHENFCQHSTINPSDLGGVQQSTASRRRDAAAHRARHHVHRAQRRAEVLHVHARGHRAVLRFDRPAVVPRVRRVCARSGRRRAAWCSASARAGSRSVSSRCCSARPGCTSATAGCSTRRTAAGNIRCS